MSKGVKVSRPMLVLALAAGLLITLTLVIVFDPFEDQIRRYPNGGLSDFNDTSYYKMNPETIMSALDRGETDVFLPEPATPEAPVIEGPIKWHQSDYLRIAIALRQFVWKDNIDSWNLYFAQFEANCEDNATGFRLADLYYYKTVFINGKIEYAARELLIAPEYGDVSVGAGMNFPHPLLGWKSLNLGTLKLAADDALRVAEQNGGKEFRLDAKNNCRIHVGINPNVDAADWHVVYSSNDSSLFGIYIDPYTSGVIK